jgi:hypothetical protein
VANYKVNQNEGISLSAAFRLSRLPRRAVGLAVKRPARVRLGE